MNIFPISIPIFAVISIAALVRKVFFVPDMPWAYFVVPLIIALLGDFVLKLDW